MRTLMSHAVIRTNIWIQRALVVPLRTIIFLLSTAPPRTERLCTMDFIRSLRQGRGGFKEIVIAEMDLAVH